MIPRLVLSISLSVVGALAQAPGAFYVTDPAGAIPAQNRFDAAVDVYLAGGPGPNEPCSSPGLPDGYYFFQVTDPTGTVLLSLDSIVDRKIAVEGGVITWHVLGTHATRPGPCSSRLVQVVPFAPSPDACGGHKLWVTPYQAYDVGLSGSFGFQASASRIVDFVVGQGCPTGQSQISGFVYFDHDENGAWNPAVDPLEVPIGGWRIELLRQGQVDGVTFTDQTGRYSFVRDQDATEYVVREQAPGGYIGDGVPGAVWLATTPRSGVVLANAPTVPGPDFGNLRFQVTPGVGRTKGFWHNQNGRALLLASDPLWRDVLTVRNGLPVCLRRPISTSDPLLSIYAPPQPPVPFATAFAGLSDYLTANSQGHAGYILASQVAASILNNAVGFMPGTIYVDRFNNGLLVSFDALVAGATGLLCHPDAGLTGPQGPAFELRAMMLACTNEFGGINSTGDLSEPQVVYGKTPIPGTFTSPYEP